MPLFVQYSATEPIEVDPAGCKTVSAFIEKAQKKFSPELDSVPLNKLTLHGYTGTKLNGDIKISELINQSGFENSDLTPLLIRYDDKDELKAVELNVKARKLELLKKERRPEGLTTDEQVELEHFDQKETSQELKRKQRYPKEESKSFQEADYEWISGITSINTTYREWKSFHLDDSIIPSEHFYSRLKQSVSMVHMKYKSGRRFVLNEFLLDILYRPEFKESLRIFPEVRMEVSKTLGNKKRKIIGDIDYAIGLRKGYDISNILPAKELHIIAIEAKTNWDEDDYWHCVAETATLYKSRKDAGKTNCSVWGVFSNATDWQFIFIDENGFLWTSRKISLNLRSLPEEEVVKVYRSLYFLMKSCLDACTLNPTPSSPLNDIIE